MTRRRRELPPCPSILPALCGGASPQLKLARLLLAQMPDQATFTRCLQAIRMSDSIHGPLALHWMFTTLARAVPPGKERVFYLEQADIVKNEAVLMRRLKGGWSNFGVDDPWDVVHPPKEPWLPRYHSEPILRPFMIFISF